MKILQINTAANTGSTGKIAEQIGNTLIQNGHQSYIAYGRGNRPSRSNLVKIGSQKDVYQHKLITLFYDKHGLGSKRATKDFIKKLETIKPDAIGLQNIHGYYINYEILFEYLKNKNIPILWTFHDCWPFTGHCSFFDSVGCRKWKTHCQHCPITKNYPKALRDRSYQNFEDKKEAFKGLKHLRIVTPSHWLANFVKDSFLNTYPVHVIHNGIDLNVFRPLEDVYENNTKIILGVASTWDIRKGLKDFVQLRKALNSSYKIVLIGLSQKQIAHLPSGISGIQRTENVEALVEWYNKASIFVNPTYVDNFPTTNIEALACGTPVITYNTGGSPEALGENTGTSVDKGDINALKEAIMSLTKNKDRIKICRQRAVKHFNAQERYQDYLNLYKNLI